MGHYINTHLNAPAQQTALTEVGTRGDDHCIECCEKLILTNFLIFYIVALALQKEHSLGIISTGLSSKAWEVINLMQ